MGKKLLPQNETVVVYISADNEYFWLYGGHKAGAKGVYLLEGPEGIAALDIETLWSDTARGIGAKYRGKTIEKRDLDLPIMVTGDTSQQYRVRNRVFMNALTTHRPGYLGFFTTSTGWRWIQVRCGGINVQWGQDPARSNHCQYDVSLIAGDPLYKGMKISHEWRAVTTHQTTDSGEIRLRNHGDEASWADFHVVGPGSISLRYGAQKIDLPNLGVGEEVLIHTEPRRQTIRSSTRGNAIWKDNPSLRFTEKIEPNLNDDVICEIVTTGAGVGTSVTAHMQQRFKQYA